MEENMQDAMAADMGNVQAASASRSSAVSHHQMPLSFLKNGEEGLVVKVRASKDLHHHLENLGFVEGTKVKIVCTQAGNLIVEVKGAQVAINRQVASQIIVK